MYSVYSVNLKNNTPFLTLQYYTINVYRIIIKPLYSSRTVYKGSKHYRLCTCIVGSAQCSGCVVYGPSAMAAVKCYYYRLCKMAKFCMYYAVKYTWLPFQSAHSQAIT